MNSLPPKRNIQLSAIYVLKGALVIKKKYSANTPEMKQKKLNNELKVLMLRTKNINYASSSITV